jgi:hypothetical protein
MDLFAAPKRAENHLHRPLPGRETGVASVVRVGFPALLMGEDATGRTNLEIDGKASGWAFLLFTTN